MTKKVSLICDLQFGSTGKGLIAGLLAERDEPDVLVTAWSANAGHTYINAEGRTFVHCMLANGIVSPKTRYVLLGPGSNLDVKRLEQEIAECADLLQNAQVLVHPHAAIILPEHVSFEKATMTGIGSTAKGCGASLVHKIRRPVIGSNVVKDVHPDGGVGWKVAGYDEYNEIVDNAERIQVEGHQGFSLGMNTGFYPYVTSRECTPAQIMTDCHLPISMLDKVIGCMRTFPIRTADRFDEDGNMIGWCGPCYPDQQQLDWEQVGVPAELTTVTGMPRKIYTFSEKQSADAIRSCAPDEIFLNFCNYLPDVASLETLQNLITSQGGVVKYLGYGPKVTNVITKE